MKNKYPIYIVSKGRYESLHTPRALDRMNIPYFLVIEENEYELYAKKIDENKILLLDKKFQEEYETLDSLGSSKSKGPGAARNFAWEHSISIGKNFHWVMDDNINGFVRLNRNSKIQVSGGSIFRAMEDFIERYDNVTMAGPNYRFFAKQRQKLNPFIINTRIYSCNLIKNNSLFRWRGRYNEDTDLSLRMLKNGDCTIQFNSFLQNKMATQTVKGGCDKDFYSLEGTKPKSEMLVKMHPDCSKLVFKFGRWHHHVDYTGFQKNILKKKKNIIHQDGINNYGMKLVKIN